VSDPSVQRPSVSIILPCRNEVRSIGSCLESILASAYPREQLQVLVADGMSDDGTREIIEQYAANHPYITLLDNPDHITPTGLNIALRAATGDVIMRMDAHATYPPEYIPRLVAALEETGADNVGTVVVTLPGDETAVARAIALGLSHPLGVGNSHFRVGSSTRRWVDHVPFGCWRRGVFARLGPFDEELARGQDVEFNARLISCGGRVLLLPDVAARYQARRCLGQLARMLYQYGYCKPLVARKVGRIMTLRQLVPALFVVSLLGTGSLSLWWTMASVLLITLIGAYAAVLLGCAVPVVFKHGTRVGLALMAALPLMHLGYGIGYLRGLCDHLLLVRRGRRPRTDVALTR
jgi:hypothetical protein